MDIPWLQAQMIQRSIILKWNLTTVIYFPKTSVINTVDQLLDNQVNCLYLQWFSDYFYYQGEMNNKNKKISKLKFVDTVQITAVK